MWDWWDLDALDGGFIVARIQAVEGEGWDCVLGGRL